MGFWDSFKKAANSNKRNSEDKEFQEIIDLYADDERNNYRATGLENTQSNHGWYICIKCGKKFRRGDMDIDHIIPKSCGGPNTRDNLQCICKHCNRSKQADMSETDADLRRREKELNEQDRMDREFLRLMSQMDKDKKRRK